jgi:vacuolar-type H+-ATPase subunit E/Vma4
MNREEAIEELKSVNNNLTLLMKKKKALQSYINEENERLGKIETPKQKAWRLKKDVEFVKLYGRERTDQEVADEMYYSLRQIQRFLNK